MEQAGSTNVIKEGCAEVYFPEHVFYNPVQEFNRDLTIAVISQYGKLLENEKGKRRQDRSLRCEKVVHEEVCSSQTENSLPMKDGLLVLEALAASGLRSVRFGLEIPCVKEVTANDFDLRAFEMIKRNVTKNQLEGIVKANCGDAAMHMYGKRRYYDVVDLDPYGSPSPFLDSAVQSVVDGGLLCITCTDTAVLCSGNASATCMAKYASVSLNAKFCHEMALRIALHCVQSHASRYSRYIVPLISVSADFYVRLFVRVFTGQAKVKQVLSKLAMVYNCTGCGSYHLQDLGTKTPTGENNFKYGNAVGPRVSQKCSECNSSFHIGGPVWNDAIHDLNFVKSVVDLVAETKDRFKTADRIIGMMNLIMEELPDVAFYYVTDSLCGTLHCTPPSMLQLRSAILNAGFKVSLSHCAQNSVKTTAPPSVLWDLMRCWVKKNPVHEKHRKSNVVKSLLDKDPVLEACFEVRDDANPKSRQQGLLRWQVNPQPYWGPKSRASRSAVKETQVDKKLRLQNKRGKKNEQNIDKKQFPCKKFKEGQCDRGDDCYYLHNKVGEENVEMDH